MKLPRPFNYLMNKTTRREVASQPTDTTISACHVGPVEDISRSPAASEDLKNAWAEVEAAAKESDVLKFHACSRIGELWQNDPASVRAVAAMLRES